MYQKSKSKIISDAICGILFLVSILVYIFVGLFAHIWHPTWVMIPCTAIVCWIISIIENAYSNLHKKEEKKANKE